MASSRSVVLAALIANGAIAILKFVGFLLTGSAAMLSETYHSISDTGNQVFLLIGIRFGKKDASQRHPFGYGKAQFFYSFLVSVLLFGIAGWESAKHGYNKIVGGHHEKVGDVELLGYAFDPILVNYTVLLGAIVFEAWAFKKAYTAMSRQIEANDWSGFREAFRKTSDVTTLTALTEDTIAMSGAGIALMGVFLSRQLGDPIYDAIAALLIGLMLMGFALALAWENKRLLLGESLPEVDEEPLRRIVREWDDVDRIVDFRTVYFGPNRLLVTADVEFTEGLDTTTIDEHITGIEDAIKQSDTSVYKVYVEPEV